MVRYFRHKENKEVYCEIVPLPAWGDHLRFTKWAWKNGVCSEVFTIKEITPEFFQSFEEITQKEFNNDWGNKLQKA